MIYPTDYADPREAYPIDLDPSELLKPCPFCGSESVDIIWNRNGEFAVNCNATRGGCGATSGYAPTREAAVKAWNRRVNNEGDGRH